MQALSQMAGAASMDRATIAQIVTELVVSYVGNDVQRDMPLAQQGLDSLASMELRQKLQVSLSAGHVFHPLQLDRCLDQDYPKILKYVLSLF